jgi:hypothetical protein
MASWRRHLREVVHSKWAVQGAHALAGKAMTVANALQSGPRFA